MLNGLTLRISRQYKWLRFKDIVQGFGKLKKRLKKNGMEYNGLQDQKIEQFGIVWNEWNGLPKHGGNLLTTILHMISKIKLFCLKVVASSI